MGAVRLGGVVSGRLIGGSRGHCPRFRLSGGVARLGGVGPWLRGCVAVPPAFVRSPWLASAGRSAVSCSQVGRASPPPRCFWFFTGIRGCKFLPLPSLGWCMHWSVSGVADWLGVPVAGEHVHAANDALARKVGRTSRKETPLRAGSRYRRRSPDTTPWQGARQRRTRGTRPGMPFTPSHHSGSQRRCGVHPQGSARPRGASCRRSWRGKQPPSKR